MSDEIPTPRTEAECKRIKDALNAACSQGDWPVPVVAIGADFARQLERELVTAQARIRELEAASVPKTHRTCSECHQYLPVYLFPALAGNQSICGQCYYPCGEAKT